MGSAEPIQPDPENPLAPERADWLVGPEEGLAAEMQRRAAESTFMARPALLRPGASAENPAPAPFVPDADEPRAAERAGVPLPPALASPSASAAPSAPETTAAKPKRFGAVLPEHETGSDFVHGPAMTWQPGARSVPSIHREPARTRVPEPSRDFPMDDAEERARARAAAIEAAMADAIDASRPHEVIPPEAFNVETVPVPWWIQFAHVLRSDRRLQLMVLGVLLVLGTIAAWPRGERPTSVGDIRRHPDRFDGAAVKVAGRVGQVFSVGGGYAFYLLDGGDTLVVFTRSRVPVERRRIRVGGTMSNGWLDGHATLALFETPSTER